VSEVVNNIGLAPYFYKKMGYPILIKDREEVQDNLNLAYDSVKIEKIKKEILACRYVITS